MLYPMCVRVRVCVRARQAAIDQCVPSRCTCTRACVSMSLSTVEQFLYICVYVCEPFMLVHSVCKHLLAERVHSYSADLPTVVRACADGDVSPNGAFICRAHKVTR